ncbi:unnamed protein product [Rotaria sordida]|uniref:Uncharacterized protein n=1 Tax=Rotaria sordida TaxID=392033 RepID=A0A814Y870_9BILA|nr:unnamed protein product [Rotaria sordida]CAF4097321.1 unnamed protein product [Rotaria sordida]
MLTRFIAAVHSPSISISTSLRLLNTSTLRLTDGDHTLSKALNNAVEDIKAGLERKWLDTLATDSESVVKGEKQHDRKHRDWKKDMTELQLDTIQAIQEKAAKGYMHQYDVGRRDTREDRIDIDVTVNDVHKQRMHIDVDPHDKHKEKVDIDITVKTHTDKKH